MTHHPAIVEYSARQYLDSLLRWRANQSLGSQGAEAKAIDNLITTLTLALEKRMALSADDITFTAQDLQGLSPQAVGRLVNQWCLGFGEDDARVLAMGTEEAYSTEHPEDLALWNCAGAVLWLCGGNRAVVERIDPRYAGYGLNPGQPDIRRPFHIHSNDYFHVEQAKRVEGKTKLPGRHTWVLLSQVLAGPDGDRMEYLRAGSGQLGQAAYQIEVSAHPALKAQAGVAPTPDRLQFLKRLADEFRTTADVLLFHGRAQWPEWGDRDQIAMAFLGLNTKAALNLQPSQAFGRQRLYWSRQNRKTVLFTWALNGALRNDYLAAISHLINEVD